MPVKGSWSTSLAIGPALVPSTLREAQRALTRGRLFEAARDCFFEKGFTGTTIDDIAASAGVSRATFYLHYKSKNDVIQDIQQKLEPILKDIFNRLGDRPYCQFDAVANWMNDLYEILKYEKKALTILHEAQAHGVMAMSDIGKWFDVLISILGSKIPAFGIAAEQGINGAMRVRAQLLLMQLDSSLFYLVRKQWRADKTAVLNELANSVEAFIALGSPT